MADNTNSGWEQAPEGAVPLQISMRMNDLALQANHPNWPMGGTQQQLTEESNLNPNAVSPKGAEGMVQAMPETKAAVEKQIGRKLDFSNINDQLLFHRYLMNQNLDRAKGNVNQALSLYNSGRMNANNPETNNYVSKFDSALPQVQGGGTINNNSPSNASGGWEPVPGQDQGGWEAVPKGQEPGLWENIKGLGMQAANIGVGGLESIPIALHAGYEGLKNGSLQSIAQTGAEDFSKYSPESGLNALGINTDQLHNTAGYQLPAKAMNLAFDTVPKVLGEGMARTGELEAGMSPSEYTPEAGQQAKIALQAGMILAPLTGLGGLFRRGKLGPTEAELAARKVAGEPENPGSIEHPAWQMGPFQEGHGPLQDQANAGPQRPPMIVDNQGNVTNPLTTDPNMDFYRRAALARQQSAMGPNAGPQQPGQVPANSGPQIPQANAFARGIMQPVEPNMGPQRPPISVDQFGNASPQWMPPEVGNVAGQERAASIVQQQAGDLFPETLNGEGNASTFNPNRLSSEVQEPFNPRNPTNLRQGQLDFDQANPADMYQGDQFGNVGTPEAMEAMRPYRDAFNKRVSDFNEQVKAGNEFTQGDLFNELDQRRMDQFGTAEAPRVLTHDEFYETLNNLMDQRGTVMPDDRIMEAYSRYLDTVDNKQGGLFDRPTIAENFAKALDQSHIDEMVANHPAVKTAQAQVSRLTDELNFMKTTGFGDLAGQYSKLDQAKATLAKATANIKKFFKDSVPPTKTDDGVIQMHMGLRPPDWLLNGVGKMLQAFHGIVFRKLSNIITRARPSDTFSMAKAIRNGIADRIKQEANRDWDVAKNQRELQKIKEGPLAKFDAIKEFIPDNRPYEDLAQDPHVQAAPDMDSNIFTRNFGQGGQWVSAISKNPYVKWAVTHFQDAQKKTDYLTKEWLTDKSTGLQTKMRALSDSEKGEIYAHMDLNEGERTFTDGELRAKGFNEKQVDFYRTFQDTMGKVLDLVNAARQRAGMEPVDPRIAYMTSRFVGDFRSLVYRVADDGHRYVVGYVGHNFRPTLKAIIKHIDEQNPGKYEFEEPKLNVPSSKNPENMFQGYMNALDMLSKTDADVKAIVDSYRAFLTKNSQKMLNALQHAKEKRGVFGAEGKKAWEDQKTNAEKGMKSQLTYAQNMIKWSNFQDAAGEVKKFMSDDSLKGKQDNAKTFVDAYQANAMGNTQTAMRQIMNGLLNGVAEHTGIGPSYLRSLNNFQKSALLQMWLGFFRIPHAMLTLTQFFQSNPAFAQMIHDRGITDVKFWGHSLQGLNTATKLGLKAMGKGVDLTPREQAIWDYNKRNGVFNVNLKDHLTDINNSPWVRRWNHVTESNILYPELALRATTFSTWTHALHEAGMPLKEALGTAENMTRMALVDYRPIERPLVFGKMGFLGDIASTLTRFKMNQLSQHMYFGKNALKQGDLGALGTLLATSVAFAGASGLLGFAQANFLYNQYTTHVLGKPDTLKALFLRHLPDWANYGVFSQLGINMQGSYSNADTIPEDPLAAMFPTGDTLRSMVGSIYDAAKYHDMASAKKLLYDFSPTSIKGIEENYMFSSNSDSQGNKKFYRPGTGELQSVRTPGEQTLRNLAYHPMSEARNYDVAGQAKVIGEQYADLRSKDIKRITDIMQTRQPTQQEWQEFQQDWQQHRGTPEAAQDIVKWALTHNTTQMQRARGLNPTSIEDLYRIMDINKMKGSMK